MIARHKINTIQLFSALACLFFTTISPAQAEIITDNTGEPSDAGVLSSGSWAAQSFTTDATVYELSRISIQATSGLNLTLSLYDNNAGVPGSLIHTLTGPTNFGFPEQLRIYTPTSVVLLNASTTYFVVAKASGGLIDWRLTPSTAQTGPGSIGDGPFASANSGASWAGPFGMPVKLRVEGTPVPEPSSLLCLGLVGVGLLSDRRVETLRRSRARA